jgi:hypothetical protein
VQIRTCKFSSGLETKFPSFKGGRNETEAELTVSKYYLSVANKGSYYLEAHVNSSKDKKAIQRRRNIPKVSEFFCQTKHKNRIIVTTAEGALSFHVA